MNQLQVVTSKASVPMARLTRQSKLFKSIINAILEKKGEKIISLDLRKIPEAISDFFVICEATSGAQVKSIADHIQDMVKQQCGEYAHRHEGYQHAKWVLVDYVNVVIHIMQPETRQFYRLEDMWSDAPSVEHLDQPS